MNRIGWIGCLLLLWSCCWLPVRAQSYRTEKNVYYKNADADLYSRERCKLDVYYPEGEKGFKTLVWFHGGGMTGGNKYIPALMKEKGVCIVAPNYRLSPKAQHPAYIEDAAAAVAWVKEHIAEYGGDPEQIYIGGHSAGGYLVNILALDKRYLAACGVDADSLRGVFSVSGQAMTHFAIRDELGLPHDVPYIDDYAPLRYVRATTAPFLILCGENDLEMACRTAECRYLYEALKTMGNTRIEFHEIGGFNHGGVMGPAQLLMLRALGVK